jgi:hypothetical protein
MDDEDVPEAVELEPDLVPLAAAPAAPAAQLPSLAPVPVTVITGGCPREARSLIIVPVR